MLIKSLPADAATVRALAPEAAWTTGEYLLAQAVDSLRVANWLTVEVNKKKSAKNPYPDRVIRPGDKPKPEPKRLTGPELAEWLGGTI